MDILTGENLSSIWLDNMNLIYWSVCSSSRRGWGYHYLASCKHDFNREHKNLVQNPSNNISTGNKENKTKLFFFN